MNQKRVYKTYTQEFKQEAVALVTEQGYSVAEAARSLVSALKSASFNPSYLASH